MLYIPRIEAALDDYHFDADNLHKDFSLSLWKLEKQYAQDFEELYNLFSQKAYGITVIPNPASQ